jgi:hypothetical protein
VILVECGYAELAARLLGFTNQEAWVAGALMNTGGKLIASVRKGDDYAIMAALKKRRLSRDPHLSLNVRIFGTTPGLHKPGGVGGGGAHEHTGVSETQLRDSGGVGICGISRHDSWASQTKRRGWRGRAVLVHFIRITPPKVEKV